jgi:hypothetical protein
MFFEDSLLVTKAKKGETGKELEYGKLASLLPQLGHLDHEPTRLHRRDVS